MFLAQILFVRSALVITAVVDSSCNSSFLDSCYSNRGQIRQTISYGPCHVLMLNTIATSDTVGTWNRRSYCRKGKSKYFYTYIAIVTRGDEAGPVYLVCVSPVSVGGCVFVSTMIRNMCCLVLFNRLVQG